MGKAEVSIEESVNRKERCPLQLACPKQCDNEALLPALRVVGRRQMLMRGVSCLMPLQLALRIG
jgi:hypothetical protein